MKLFSKKIYEVDPPAIGLDISDNCMRAVLLNNVGPKQIKVIAYAEQEIQKGLIEDGLIKNSDALMPLFRNLKKKGGLGFLDSKFVVADLPEQNAFLQVFSVPKMNSSEISQAIRWEIEGNIPMSLNEVYFDWQEIEPIGDSIDHIDVMVVAAPKGITESYVSLLESAKFIPKSLEVESSAIARALIPKNFASKPVLIIDFGGSRTGFIIFAGTAIRFTSSLPISGYQMTQAVAQAMNISFEDAEAIKREVGINKSSAYPKAVAAMTAIVDDLVLQIQRYLEYYKNHTFHEHNMAHSISKILLAGGGANLKGLAPYLGSKLKFDVEIGNPWTNILEMPFKELPSLPFELSLSFTTAIGLALSGLDHSTESN